MKNKGLIALLMIALTAFSCRKKSETGDGDEANATPPTITLNGASTLLWTVGTAYLDSGATATDAAGNSLVVNVDESDVNTAVTGQYQVIYTATDAQGISAQKVRTINVGITKANWIGSWSVVHNLRAGTPNANLIAENCAISEFSNLYTFEHTGGGISTPDVALDGTVTGNNVSIASKLITIYPSPLPNTGTYNLTGTGSINNEGDEIIINYQWTGVCTFCGNGSGLATYAKL